MFSKNNKKKYLVYTGKHKDWCFITQWVLEKMSVDYCSCQNTAKSHLLQCFEKHANVFVYSVSGQWMLLNALELMLVNTSLQSYPWVSFHLSSIVLQSHSQTFILLYIYLVVRETQRVPWRNPRRHMENMHRKSPPVPGIEPRTFLMWYESSSDSATVTPYTCLESVLYSTLNLKSEM